MDIKEHTTPEKLEKYSFLYSEIRLLVAAVALIIGGMPPVMYVAMLVPALMGLLTTLLTLGQILSGVAAGYLLYLWQQKEWRVFGAQKGADIAAFAIMIGSGLHLGIAGLFRVNIGMTVTMSYSVFVIAGILYVLSAIYLFKRWKEKGEQLF